MSVRNQTPSKPAIPSAARPVTPLRQRMIDNMKIRNLSPATQRAYVHAVKHFSLHLGRSPDQPRNVSWGLVTRQRIVRIQGHDARTHTAARSPAG